jgi:hypothetical protein
VADAAAAQGIDERGLIDQGGRRRKARSS